MKPFSLLIKYYCFSVLFGVLIGANSYLSKSDPSILLNLFLYIFLVWGLTYSHLKESKAVYSIQDASIVYLGLSIPAALIVFFASPSSLGVVLTTFEKALSVGAILLCNALFLKFVFSVSESLILSAPDEEEYDS